ncbi:hypothetical protein SBOR_9751 [Sclerotinia borealis F-4128]|uniref:Uncharacterized protein n=1 Tax=Sclerotinia borealis (strain F-4128) TaxID=1432307 RepID=W9C2F4_SCLBF|nr:hypothetical protein SBOR_9751 [Sclerotinia borealis F-4128]
MPKPSLRSRITLNNGIKMPRIHLGVYMTSGHETVTAVTIALSAGYEAFEEQVGFAINNWLNVIPVTGLRRN